MPSLTEKKAADHQTSEGFSKHSCVGKQQKGAPGYARAVLSDLHGGCTLFALRLHNPRANCAEYALKLHYGCMVNARKSRWN
jgi:hypothetical protein